VSSAEQLHSLTLTRSVEEKGLDHRSTEPQAFLRCSRWGLFLRREQLNCHAVNQLAAMISTLSPLPAADCDSMLAA
jgi:hypothetical protein